MSNRSRLDEIEDYHFAVKKLVHRGLDQKEVEILLKDRGAGEDQINQTIKTIYENYQGVRLLECSKTLRAVNFLIDLFIIINICYLTHWVFKTLASNDYMLPVLVVPFLYYLIFETLTGQTVGKLITGTIVVNHQGKIPSILTITVRTACRYIPKNFYSAIFSDNLLHDTISKSYVVNKNRWLELYEIK